MSVSADSSVKMVSRSAAQKLLADAERQYNAARKKLSEESKREIEEAIAAMKAALDAPDKGTDAREANQEASHESADFASTGGTDGVSSDFVSSDLLDAPNDGGSREANGDATEKSADSNLENALNTGSHGASEDALKAPYDRLSSVMEKRLKFARKSGTREIVESLLFALAFALVLRTFFVEPFKIPTRSMVPTLLEGDQLFVTKLSYGIRLPILNRYVAWFSKPERGDVVVFAFPREEAKTYLARTNSGCLSAESLSEDKDYIKRIIGVEGDTIEIVGQTVYVNGAPIPQVSYYERTVADFMYLTDRRRENWNTEHLGHTQYTTITHEMPSAHFGPITVAPGHIFAMGDNRDNSADSRCWGQVPIDNIKGRAQIIWWSTGHWSPRWERMFTKIK